MDYYIGSGECRVSGGIVLRGMREDGFLEAYDGEDQARSVCAGETGWMLCGKLE